MKTFNQRFSVTYQYPVYFTEHLFNQDNSVLRNFFITPLDHVNKKVLLILDEEMLEHWVRLNEDIYNYFKTIPGIALAEKPIYVPGGEVVKNDERYYRTVVEAINQYGVDRHSFVIAIGGGSVLDMAGFASAVSHRGIQHIRIPTTVLSQNDSGVGVKNGINFFGKKNFLGTFSPPVAVFNDSDFLETLDDRNWRSGIAEAIKVALIKDIGFFEWIEMHVKDLVNRSEAVMANLIYRCATLHLQHISAGDPFESGSSRPLDFGHWSAHKLEQLSNFSVLHGEAVGIGIALDTLYSYKIGWLKEDELRRTVKLLQALNLDIFHPLLKDPALMKGMVEFREHLGGELTIMMLKGIGKGENTHTINESIMMQCIHLLEEYVAARKGTYNLK